MYQRWREKHPPKGGPTREELIFSKFERTDGCWMWTGASHNQGYGQFGKPSVLAHRLVYEMLIGPLADDTTLDHLCHPIDGSCPGGRACPHRRCVNPAHLEPVTLATNVLRGLSPPAVNARKTHCPKGHPYDDVNTYFNPTTGWRLCRSCIAERRSCDGR